MAPSCRCAAMSASSCRAVAFAYSVAELRLGERHRARYVARHHPDAEALARGERALAVAPGFLVAPEGSTNVLDVAGDGRRPCDDLSRSGPCGSGWVIAMQHGTGAASRVEVATGVAGTALREIRVGSPARVRVGERQDARYDLLERRLKSPARAWAARPVGTVVAKYLANACLEGQGNPGLPAVPLRPSASSTWRARGSCAEQKRVDALQGVFLEQFDPRGGRDASSMRASIEPRVSGDGIAQGTSTQPWRSARGILPRRSWRSRFLARACSTWRRQRDHVVARVFECIRATTGDSAANGSSRPGSVSRSSTFFHRGRSCATRSPRSGRAPDRLVGPVAAVAAWRVVASFLPGGAERAPHAIAGAHRPAGPEGGAAPSPAGAGANHGPAARQ